MQNFTMSKYKDEMIKSLSQLVAIESVANTNEGTEEYPFGPKSAEAIDFMMSLANKMGFQTENCSNYACHAQLGEGSDDDYAAVLTHVDVVPLGSGWDTDPLVLTEKDGYLYGRGVADDKGAAIVSLYCLKAMQDNGVEMKRPVRCIFGGGEEIGMDDMANYFAKHKLPIFAFTPDADYPMCNCEKGILHINFSAMADKSIVAIKGGSAINCVADSCTATVRCSEEVAKIICDEIKSYGLTCDCNYKNGLFEFSAKGVSAHAMCPQNGKNAIDGFMMAATSAELFSDSSAEKFFAEHICGGLNGEKIGVDCHDEVSGNLTMNVGTVSFSDETVSVRVDIRYPATIDSSGIIEKIKAAAQNRNISVEITGDNKPLYVPEDHPLIKSLGECYTEVTGQTVRPISMGGGTYARALGGRGVAFGLVFPESQPSNLHMPNENFSVEDFMRHAEICYKAMCRLAVLDAPNE